MEKQAESPVAQMRRTARPRRAIIPSDHLFTQGPLLLLVSVKLQVRNYNSVLLERILIQSFSEFLILNSEFCQNCDDNGR